FSRECNCRTRERWHCIESGANRLSTWSFVFEEEEVLCVLYARMESARVRESRVVCQRKRRPKGEGQLPQRLQGRRRENVPKCSRLDRHRQAMDQMKKKARRARVIVETQRRRRFWL